MDQLTAETSPARNAAGFSQGSYAKLPDRFFSRADLSPVAAPKLIKLNRQLAEELRLDVDFLASDEGLAVLAGNASPKDVQPLALAYAGHQFGAVRAATRRRARAAHRRGRSTATANAATSS